MDAMLSKEIQAGLDAARQRSIKAASRLRVEVDGRRIPVLRLEPSGFVVASKDAPHVRGLVDLHDGAQHLLQCLVVAGEEDRGEMRYDFKRATPVMAAAALDFEQSTHAPAALIPSSFG